MPAPSYTGLNLAKKTFYTESIGLGFRKSRFWLWHNLSKALMQLTLFLCVLYLLTMVGLSPSFGGPLCKWGEWKYSVAQLVGTICFPKGTNLHPYLWHYGVDLASVPPSCLCASLARHRQISWWSKLHWQFLFSLKYHIFFCYFFPPTSKSRHRWILRGLRPDRAAPFPELGSKVQSWSSSSKLSPIRKPPSCKCFPEASPGSDPSCLSLGSYVSSHTLLWTLKACHALALPWEAGCFP